MPAQKAEKKLPRGRPPKYTMPELIHDSVENVVRACTQGPPKKAWKFLKESPRKR